MELNREQIIKALECCTNCTCNHAETDTECPLVKMSFCKNYLMKQSLSLINELTEENERLRAEGEWLPQFEGARIVKCSVCGYEYCDLIECGNYCGNCGAKMDGERREENEGLRIKTL